MLPKPAGGLRPITLLKTLSKVYERILRHSLSCFLNPLLRDQKWGFIHARGTAQPLFLFSEAIFGAFNCGSELLAVSFDVSRAFDSALHCVTLAELVRLATLDYLTAAVDSFLSLRSTRLGTSSLFALERGTPQGSVLSPLLFAVLTETLGTPLRPVC